jgi:hypothetical protein
MIISGGSGKPQSSRDAPIERRISVERPPDAEHA